MGTRNGGEIAIGRKELCVKKGETGRDGQGKAVASGGEKGKARLPEANR